jgi:hypothetical protein
MDGLAPTPNTKQYAKCIENSKRIRWDIDKDVIRNRAFDFSKKFLPDGLSMADGLLFLSAEEKKLFSQVQGRTYANMFGLVERFIGAKMLEISKHHWLGNQVALEALVRFTDEELKHQELFRRVEEMMARGMPSGYHFFPAPNDVANAVLGASTWAVLALTCHIELFTQAHYRSSIDNDANLSELWKDIFLFHWKEESQHAVLDELEWIAENERISEAQRDACVNDLIGLVAAVHGILVLQSGADNEYFQTLIGRTLSQAEQKTVQATFLDAYRHQYIVTGVQNPRFGELLGSMITPEQMGRIQKALVSIDCAG